jgi:hypothetical protein
MLGQRALDGRLTAVRFGLAFGFGLALGFWVDGLAGVRRALVPGLGGGGSSENDQREQGSDTGERKTVAHGVVLHHFSA